MPIALPSFTAGFLVLLIFYLPDIAVATSHLGLVGRAVISMAAIVPAGIAMGMFFPLGMRLEDRNGSGANAPWYFALNGTFGVLASALGVAIAIEFGISANLWIGVACYALTIPCLLEMFRRGVRGS